MSPPRLCTAFIDTHRLAGGPAPLVALAVREALRRDPLAPVLVFDDATGEAVDFDLRGTEAEMLARLAPPPAEEAPARGRGRPRLGVTAREVTLLPQQWAWLAAQPGGASVVLRRLVEAARRADDGPARARAAQAAAYRFTSAIAGNFAGFEEAARALFAADLAGFEARMAGWPEDVRAHAMALARG
ncbi:MULTISPECIES: DUF2239 family protein [Roseomonadaceae]|uniref:DUF2239 family protein n=1 Tax=Falsiroseomonas oleicola TaxID=2801474 RepID=A0ABS6HDN9_9PROT|nr:DUF2239 family protein [Roseomonas oleicola]MBU8546456.1 DUF2239 family protein [Roseomonas oleicola]